MLLAAPAAAHPLKIATWNLQWLTLRPKGDPGLPSTVLPKTLDAIARLRGYADQLNADVVAFQEADGPGMAARVFTADRYRIMVENGTELQRAGFAVRNGIGFTRNPDLTALALRHQGMRAGADITVTFNGASLRLLNVQLKSGCADAILTRSDDTGACATLHRQIPILQQWIAARAADGGAFVLLGDFNRRLAPQEQIWKALQREADLTLVDEGQETPCWGGGSFVDHLIAGGAARDWLVPGSLRVLVYREQDPSWKALLSAHCPVSARFDAGSPQ